MMEQAKEPLEHLRARLDAALVLPLVPLAARDAITALWALDARLGTLAYQGREPALRAIRLKWWEEQLSALWEDDVTPPDPLLARCRLALAAVPNGAMLAELAQRWADEADGEVSDGARGAILFALSATAMGRPASDNATERAGRGWAMVDRLLMIEAASDQDWAGAAACFASSLSGLPRPLAAITALHRRIARAGGARARAREQGLLLRVGLIGR